MSDLAYDGNLGYPFSFTFTPLTITFTPLTSASFGSAQAQVEEADVPEVTMNTPKFTPISGANAGVEQFVIANAPVKEYKITATYSKASYIAALACFNAKIKGTLVCTYSDGAVETWIGSALTAVGPGKVDGSGLRKASMTFTVPASQTVA